VRLDRVARRIVQELRCFHPATRVTFSELPIIDADPAVVHHVLANVIADAFDHSAQAPDPEVEISIDTRGLLQVIDNGPACATQDAANTRLADAQRRLDRHGGWMRAEWRKGSPRRFTISFEA
jgi:K+-sensing histidine kinase KdpD